MKLKIKYILFATTFCAPTPLLAADTMDVLAPTSTSGSLIVVPQESSKEWTREEKLRVFRDVQDQLTPYDLTLNQEEVIDEGKVDFSDKLSLFLPDIQNQILTEICKFTWLTHLHLNDNNLAALPSNIKALSELKEFSVVGNKFTALPPEIWTLRNLIGIFADENKLTTLPSDIMALTQLQELCLEQNRLTNLPPEISALTQLQRLSLSNNHLTALPPEIGTLMQLEKLKLDSNQLTELPPQIGALTQLKLFWLSQNKLTSLPSAIGTLTQLEELYLDANELTHLPSQIGVLTQLQRLDLYNNKLTALPPEIGLLTQLTELLLASNRLMTLPASIRHIRALTLFDLQRNPLLPTGETPEEWGRQRLREHFGDRLLISGLSLENMPDTTTAEEVYGALDVQNLRLNREKFTALRLPDIHVDKVFSANEMLEALNQIIEALNLTNEQGEAYLSYEILANDFASDGRTSALTNAEKVKVYLMPRLTGYIRGLYGVELEQSDIRPWTMYAAQIPETQKTLTYLLEKIRDAGDADRQALLFYQLVNGLLHCPTGQAEGINAVAYALAEGEYRVDDFVGRISYHLAVKKNTAFAQSILTKGAESTQNTHLISFYRDLLKEKLGLTAAIASFTERLGTCGADPFGGNQWNVVKVFYDVVTPHRLVDWVMGLCEATTPAISTTSTSSTSTAPVQPSSPLNVGLISRYLSDQLLDWTMRLWEKVTSTPAISTASTSSTSTAPAQRSSPLNVGLICGYLSDQKLIEDRDGDGDGDEDEDEDDNWWQAYFTADPTLDESARITRDGMMNILAHMGFVIKD